MMAVLFHVGRGLEEPSLVRKLLDVSTMPGKPQYTMAPDQPLLLYHAAYDSDDLRIRYSASTLPHTLPWHAGSGGIVVCLLVLTRHAVRIVGDNGEHAGGTVVRVDHEGSHDPQLPGHGARLPC